jgi:hypothetical protein
MATNLADIKVGSKHVGEGEVKELRVGLDTSYHLKLAAYKLLRGIRTREVVEAALDEYFAKNDPRLQGRTV